MRPSRRIACLLALSLLCGCQSSPRTVKPRPPRVTVTSPIWGRLEEEETFRASLRATERASLTSAVSERVERVLVREGDPVRLGQPLIYLDSSSAQGKLREQQAAVATAQARVENLRAQVSMSVSRVQNDIAQAEQTLRQSEVAIRQAESQRDATRRDLDARTKLFQAEAVARRRVDELALKLTQENGEVQLQQSKRIGALAALKLARAGRAQTEAQMADLRGAQAGLEQALAGLAQADQQLSACVLRSPLSGIVITRAVQPGQSVGPGGSPLLEVVDNRNLGLLASVDQRLGAELEPGMKARAFLSARSDRATTVEVEEILADPDPKTDTVKVRLRMQALPEKVLDGQRVYVKIKLPYQGWILPRGALSRKDSQPFVLSVEEGRVRRRPVKVVHESPQQVVVKGDLNKIQRIVVESSVDLTEADRVVLH